MLRYAHLVEVGQGFIEVGHHSRRWLIGDLDGRLQNALRDNVAGPVRCRLCRDVHSVVVVAAFTVLLQLLVQSGQPLLHQVNVLKIEADVNNNSL